jgi:hypothetical protein
LDLPDPQQLRELTGAGGLSRLFSEAEEIISGKVRLFGGEPVDLVLEPPIPTRHWVDYRETDFDQDIKFVWEPARFGWAITLARAYFLGEEERFAESFWFHAERFIKANPAFLGPHWMSAQEVAIRLASLVFSFPLVRSSPSSTPERVSLLSASLAQHAERIPPTLAYARAQNNNHLLTEAMGLITASFALPSHPAASQWRALGWKWFHRGLQAQITQEGEYIQHSTNYHRLMLQTALWVHRITIAAGKTFPLETQVRLVRATRWLASLLDPLSGCAPNLGPNDGANIFPLTAQPFSDYRPTLQAAGIAFLGVRLFPVGAWDEMSQWLCPKSNYGFPLTEERQSPTLKHTGVTPLVLKSSDHNSWAYLRCAHFSSRPGHADQLHVDLWWRGLNIAQDPGTYLYNTPPPWDNALTSTFVHNTITINEREQMTRAGRFLYLDWAQGEVVTREGAAEGFPGKLVARHHGYRHWGIIHERSLESKPGGWLVHDHMFSHQESQPHRDFSARLHWLLPDWDWKVKLPGDSVNLELLSPFGWITLKIHVKSSTPRPTDMEVLPIALVRAGQVIYPKVRDEGSVSPNWGWRSPTYGIKFPALSFSVKVSGALPLTFTTNWSLADTV